MVVIGGIGTLEGPFVGMLVYIVLRELLADYGAIYLMLMGALAIVVMLKAPFGIWGWVAQKYDLQLFPVSRRLTLTAERIRRETIGQLSRIEPLSRSDMHSRSRRLPPQAGLLHEWIDAIPEPRAGPRYSAAS